MTHQDRIIENLERENFRLREKNNRLEAELKQAYALIDQMEDNQRLFSAALEKESLINK